MKTKVQTNVTELFDQAVENFDSALKTGVKIQEEATKWWTDMIEEADTMQALQRRAQKMMSEFLPSAQKNIDQYMGLMDKTYRSSMDLLRRAFETSQCESIPEAQSRMQELWEASFNAMRTNARAIVQLNTKMMDSWAEMARKEAKEAIDTAETMGKHASSRARA